MSRVAVAYIPILHEGYLRWMHEHAADIPLYLIGEQFHMDYRPLAKDIRAIDADTMALALRSLHVSAHVGVLGEELIRLAPSAGFDLVMPDEDISHLVADVHFPTIPVQFASPFLRWTREKTIEQLTPRAIEIPEGEAYATLMGLAEAEAAKSIDWFRQVGAAIRTADGICISACNEHLPHPLAPYTVGDPRTNFTKGVHLDLTTAEHAEAHCIGEAARQGISLDGAEMYCTDFPCPPCAKLIARAGISRLYYREGYAVTDGEDVLKTADVEIVRISVAA